MDLVCPWMQSLTALKCGDGVLPGGQNDGAEEGFRFGSKVSWLKLLAHLKVVRSTAQGCDVGGVELHCDAVAEVGC